MVGAIAERKFANGHIITDRVMHLIPIFNVDSSTTNIVNNIVLHLRAVCTMDNDSSLMAVLHNIVFKNAVWTITNLVKVQAIFSFDTCQKQSGRLNNELQVEM